MSEGLAFTHMLDIGFEQFSGVFQVYYVLSRGKIAHALYILSARTVIRRSEHD